jgi:hypothetical protein
MQPVAKRAVSALTPAEGKFLQAALVPVTVRSNPKEKPMPRLSALLLLLMTAVMTAGCIVEEPGPGPAHDRWCYNHPYRCR